MDILKVSAQSDASATAGALANTIRESGEAELQGIGPKAINQAVKAIAIARSYLASSGVDLVAMPSFVDVEIDGEQRTALRFSILPRHQLHRPHEDGSPATATATDQTGARDDRTDDPLESTDDDVDAEMARDNEGGPSRSTSLSEAIAGRPAAEQDPPDGPDGSDDADSDDAHDADDAREDDERSGASEDDPDEPRRRSPFFGRSRRSRFDTDRDVF